MNISSMSDGTSDKLDTLSDINLKKKSLIAAGVGNVLEWFDWAIYAVFSTYIASALFDKSDFISSMLSTLAVFAVGFIMRPLGGWFFGKLADSKGRKWVLLVTMLMMAGSSLLIGCIPTYEHIEGLASFLLLLARLIQGFAHGGESTTSNVYLPEIAPKERRALYGSTVAVAMGLGIMLATVFGAGLANVFDKEFMAVWGWRIPFIFGGLLALVVLWLRRNIIETESHAELKKFHKKEAAEDYSVIPQLWSKRKIWSKSVEVFFYMAGTTLPFYIWSSYAPTYAISQKAMSPGGAFTASLCAMVINIVLVPFMGMLADKIGRRPLVIFYALMTAALTVPMFNFISAEPITLFIAQATMMGISACIGGTQPAMLVEQIPTRYRTFIMGTAMPLSVALFGGTAPYFNAWLIAQNLQILFYVYIIAMCLGTAFVVTFCWKETKGIALNQLL